MKYVSIPLAFASLFFSLMLSAPDARAYDIYVEHPWARATSPVAKAGGAFMVIHNNGQTADRLIAAKSKISTKTEVHRTKMENGIMLMQAIDGIDIPAGGKVTLKPGSYHVMFMGLKQPLTEGMTFPLTLTFQKGGDINLTVTVEAAGAGMNMKDGHNHGHAPEPHRSR